MKLMFPVPYRTSLNLHAMGMILFKKQKKKHQKKTWLESLKQELIILFRRGDNVI